MNVVLRPFCRRLAFIMDWLGKLPARALYRRRENFERKEYVLFGG